MVLSACYCANTDKRMGGDLTTRLGEVRAVVAVTVGERAVGRVRHCN